MNVLITGGRGTIGRALAREWSGRKGARVVSLGRSKSGPGDSESDVVSHETGDISDARFLDEVLERHDITHIVHAAGARTRDCRENPRLAFEANVLGTESVFQAGLRRPAVRSFAHFSTAAVYGRTAGMVGEGDLVAPGSAYALSKAASELVLASAGARERPFSTVILRPGFVLAPGASGSLAGLISDAMTRELVRGSLPERFPLHWAPDLGKALVRLTEREGGRDRLLHPPVVDMRLVDFVETLKEAVRRRGREPIFQIDPDPHAPFPAALDDSAFQALAGPVATTPLAEMLEAMLDEE